VRRGVDRRVEEICVRALRKAPEERYQSAREMRSDLRAVTLAEGTARGAPPSGPELATTLPLGAMSPALAETVHMQSPGAIDDAGVKPTLLGTTSTVPEPPKRRRRVLATALLACGRRLPGPTPPRRPARARASEAASP